MVVFSSEEERDNFHLYVMGTATFEMVEGHEIVKKKDGEPFSNNEYPRFSHDGKRPYVHQLIIMKRYNFLDSKQFPKLHQVSHLCHIKHCIAHLTLEHRDINNSRNICLNQRRSTGNVNFCNNLHEPRCVQGTLNIIYRIISR